MKISFVLEDIGAGAQVIYSSHSPEEAIQFYKARNTPGKLALVINPRLERSRKIKPENATPVVAVDPEPKRKRQSLL